mgnify:CR=1 FL=1
MGASNTIKCQLSTQLCNQFLIIVVLFPSMARFFCRMSGGPCSSFDSSADVFAVVLDRRCSRHAVRLTFFICSFFGVKNCGGAHGYFFSVGGVVLDGR